MCSRRKGLGTLRISVPALGRGQSFMCFSPSVAVEILIFATPLVRERSCAQNCAPRPRGGTHYKFRRPVAARIDFNFAPGRARRLRFGVLHCHGRRRTRIVEQAFSHEGCRQVQKSCPCAGQEAKFCLRPTQRGARNSARCNTPRATVVGQNGSIWVQSFSH